MLNRMLKQPISDILIVLNSEEFKAASGQDPVYIRPIVPEYDTEERGAVSHSMCDENGIEHVVVLTTLSDNFNCPIGQGHYILVGTTLTKLLGDTAYLFPGELEKLSVQEAENAVWMIRHDDFYVGIKGHD